MYIQNSYIYLNTSGMFTLYCNLPWATLLWLYLNNGSTDVKVTMFEKKIKNGDNKIKLLISLCKQYNKVKININTPNLAASYEVFPSV